MPVGAGSCVKKAAEFTEGWTRQNQLRLPGTCGCCVRVHSGHSFIGKEMSCLLDNGFK